jgi:hypothetical protein
MTFTIEERIFNISTDVLKAVIDNFEVCLRKVHNENGWHIEHIVS